MRPFDEFKRRSVDPMRNVQPGPRFSRLGLLINAFVTLLIVAPPLYFAAVTLWSADATDRWRQENHALWAELQARCANENDGTEKSHEFPYDSESQYSACMIEGNALNRARNPKPL